MEKEYVIRRIKSLTFEDNGPIYDKKYRVRYFDIDGKILKIEYVAEGGKLTPPAKTPNYDPDYLIFDEWNYDIENYVVEQPTDVGAIYKTVDDATYMFCDLVNYAKTLTINLNIQGHTSIDWGDGIVDTSTSHTYAKEGKYIIKIIGSYTSNCSSSSYLISSSASLEKMYISSKITSLGQYCFSKSDISVVSLPKTLTDVSVSAFALSRCLKFINIPNSNPALLLKAFSHCYSLEGYSLPFTLSDISTQIFINCINMRDVVSLPYVAQESVYDVQGTSVYES